LALHQELESAGLAIA